MILELAHNISIIWPNQLQNRTQRNAHAPVYTNKICRVINQWNWGGRSDTCRPAQMCRPAPIVQTALWSTWTDLSHAQVQSAPKDDVKRMRVVRQSVPIVLVTETRRWTWSLRQSPSRRRARALLKRTLRWRTAGWNWTARLSPTNQHQFGGRAAQVLTGVRLEEQNPNLLVDYFPV